MKAAQPIFDLSHHARFSVAPMMAWTDRHCRYFHRQITKQALLYTEMVTAPALVLGGAVHLLEHDDFEHPVALQLGGADPNQLHQATKIATDHGYHEVNLNVGCPSDRVQSGCFGAILMTMPDTVRACLEQMQRVDAAQITVKCRIGVDDQDPRIVLPEFLKMVADAGIVRVTVHARKAWLQGLSPKENREVPPLDYDLVHDMKREFPNMHLSVNGGVGDISQCSQHLDRGLDGVMVGRSAYQTPFAMLSEVDQRIFGKPGGKTALEVGHAMTPYIDAHVSGGGRIHQVTRHMFGLFAGQPGARNWRQSLTRIGSDQASTVRDYVALLDDMAEKAAAAQEYLQQMGAG